LVSFTNNSLGFKEQNIEDQWMNEKFSNLVVSNAKSLAVSKRMAATSNAFKDKRSLNSSHYTKRELIMSQRDKRKNKNNTLVNFFNPDTGLVDERSMSDFETSSPTKDILPKKEQKLKYTMDKLKLTCNKNTFLKFYHLKKNIDVKEKLSVSIYNALPKLWRPQVREESTIEVITTESGKNNGYLIGGFNGDGIKQIAKFSLTRTPKA